jgi:ABC-type lipoprotein export system ATPase subunit
MINYKDINKLRILDLEIKFPFVSSFFEDNNLQIEEYRNLSIDQYFEHFTEEDVETFAIDIEKLKNDLVHYINEMILFLGIKDSEQIDSLTIIAGKNKNNEKENFNEFEIRKGEIISIVGPTGSGKSRLLADIEWTANRDTPTNRSILINGKEPDKKWRFSTSNKLVAQLSQNMNFVMDLSVREFVSLHAKSRMIENEDEIIERIINAANYLAGEKFDLDTPITSLSGGQSRALMIADTAILSTSPIVLIDEIENAGIDRKRALKLLVKEDKIVLMATHDPTLALMADKRIVIKNGGIYKVLETKEEEKNVLINLEKLDQIIANLRGKLRNGEILDEYKGEI